MRLSITAMFFAIVANCGAQTTSTQPHPVTSGHVEDAIERAVLWINAQRNASGHWDVPEARGDRFFGGDTGLALLALLYAGEDPRAEKMAQSIRWLVDQPLAATYTRSVRAQVLSLVPGGDFKKQLADDAAWLQSAMYPPGSPAAGGYDYASAQGQTSGGWTDNSNSQFAALGVWMASEAGIDVPEEYWLAVRDYWTRMQNSDGGWSYQRDQPSTGSMSAAGLATLFIVLDRGYSLDEGRFNGKSSPFCGQHRKAAGLLAAIDSGLDWFGRNYTPDNPGGSGNWKHYYLYGVERAGRASGQKRFRGRDWFYEGAEVLLASQNPDGSWPGVDGSSHRSTCFALMFLCHGRAPIFYNKLEHSGDWNNKLRDVAGLTRYAAGTLERLYNWQSVSLDDPIDSLLEAPVLYITGHRALEFTVEEEQKLREYLDRGGLIFAVACCSEPAFAGSVRRLAARIAPEYPMLPLRSTHPILSGGAQYRIENPPDLYEVRSPTRTLMLMSADDVCAAWNQNQVKRWSPHFQLGVNVYLYATDKTPLRTRFETPTIATEESEPTRTISIARVRYDGNWDIEPYGWTRFVRYMNNRIQTRLLVSSGIRFDSPAIEDYRIAHMTGTRGFELSEAELSGLRRFLTGGGTLLADPANGSPEFLASFERAVQTALRVEPVTVPDDSPLFTGDGVTDAVRISQFGYRRTARRLGGEGAARLKAFALGKRLAVIYCPVDISVSLLGSQVYECSGLDAETSLRALRNMVLYANLTTAEKSRAAEPASP